ncbi:helix-turn-helix domain-containing protein [Streptomyces scabiei]|uniref:helix-turn-helix domain-containing protein n=1 Tax=Streptomyces scabiei TaxID=1930 RepID=UPI0029A7B61F|nr:helix-turn-helix domain-containing protein [Streptomyces scabiei]MDX3523605.1 helix-turn-helix domain-containing protein [Streptomyces scabiei]
MEDERGELGQALAKLRERLVRGQLKARLNQTELARRAGLSRGTVSAALSSTHLVPSARTVELLAAALKFKADETDELLVLQRTAAGDQGGGEGERSGPGRPIGDWEPHELEVHPAGTGLGVPGSAASAVGALPGYVPREHDRVLATVVEDAVAGRSRTVVLVGSSSTGKTRACWEAVRPLAGQGWRLWHPYHPDRAEAALEDLHRVGPRTVVWLNEAQHYLGDQAAGERIAAAVHQLLVSRERGPVLVMGTLWPDYDRQYTALPVPGAPDRHSRVRELLAGRTVHVPDVFAAPDLAAAAAFAEEGDRLLADALTRTRENGRVTQDLAGAPQLLTCYQRASPAGRALLRAAMDARRLGVGLHLPQVFLTDAVPDYLDQADYDGLTDDWAEAAYAELAELVHGKQAPLRRTTPRSPRRPPTPATGTDREPAPTPAGPQFRLADYLEQHGRSTRHHLCPPASFWHAAHTHLTHPDDLNNLAEAAERRHRLQWAHHLRQRAAEHGNLQALYHVAVARNFIGDRKVADALARYAASRGSADALRHLAKAREKAGDPERAETLARQAADHDDTGALRDLAKARHDAGDREGAEMLARHAAEHGDTYCLYLLARDREEAGDRAGAEDLYREAADLGHTDSLFRLAVLREEAGDREGAETLARQAADLGDAHVLYLLALERGGAGDGEGAEALYREAADRGDDVALLRLAHVREKAGDREGAEVLYWEAAERGETDGLIRLALVRDMAGDRERAEAMARHAADHGNAGALLDMAQIRTEVGDMTDAEALVRQAAGYGDTRAVRDLVNMREAAGDRKGAEALARQAADCGDSGALCDLAVFRERLGDREDAEALARHAAAHGTTSALYYLTKVREESGDRQGAEAVARQVADHGYEKLRRERGRTVGIPFDLGRFLESLWPHGLDPDGTPTPPWQWWASAPPVPRLPPDTA